MAWKRLKQGFLMLGIAMAINSCSEQDKHALIISGDNQAKYQHNITQAYATLKKHDFDTIYILDSNYKSTLDKWLIDFDRFRIGHYPIYGPADKKTLEKVIKSLESKIDDEDLFFLYVTDHGNRVTREINNKEIEVSTISLAKSKLTEYEFADMLRSLSPKKAIYLFDQCYSGGFAEWFGEGNIIAVASTTATESSSSYPKNSVGYFIMKGFLDSVADSDQNGRISLKEAFDYMERRYHYKLNGKQNPFIQSELEPDEFYIDE